MYCVLLLLLLLWCCFCDFLHVYVACGAHCDYVLLNKTLALYGVPRAFAILVCACVTHPLRRMLQRNYAIILTIILPERTTA